jgi:hypothetical protein
MNRRESNGLRATWTHENRHARAERSSCHERLVTND